jgi:hypothetical protein
MEGRLRNTNSDSEEDSIITSTVFFPLGMDLLVKRMFSTFSSIKSSQFNDNFHTAD